MKINIFWFRRDLRTEDNTALNEALASKLPVLPVFIFDTSIIDELPSSDPRISFIYHSLQKINYEFSGYGSSLLIVKDSPLSAFNKLVSDYTIDTVFFNRDYEPYAISRDRQIADLLDARGIKTVTCKDQVIFEKDELVKTDGLPYTVFTPYSKKWLQAFNNLNLGAEKKATFDNLLEIQAVFPSLQSLGFELSAIKVRHFDLSVIDNYDKYRNYPAEDRTSYLSPHLRFGTISIRKIVRLAAERNMVFMNELIWREFFMQILFHFPSVVTDNFKAAYNFIEWRNNEKEFEAWCRGETGYPLVDAGMRQLSQTGYMHNRVRMVVAGFLCKHLLIDWRLGEAWFAQKLLDYELSSNNGNWQWAAGTGCDAVPYFRVFNPDIQQSKFDPDGIYIKKWTGDDGKSAYPPKIVDHTFARNRAVETYKKGILRKV